MKKSSEHNIVERNVVSADVFFGLGAIMLVIVALLSVNLRTLLQQSGATRAIENQTLSRAVEAFSRINSPVILAQQNSVIIFGIHQDHLEISLDDVLRAPEVNRALGQRAMLITTPNGLDAHFLVLANAHAAGITSVETLRLHTFCQYLEQEIASGQILCGKE